MLSLKWITETVKMCSREPAMTAKKATNSSKEDVSPFNKNVNNMTWMNARNAPINSKCLGVNALLNDGNLSLFCI